MTLILRAVRFQQVNRACVFLCAMVLSVMLAGKSAAQPPQGGRFEVRPWEVGQFAEYQIIHFEDEGAKNRYKVSLVGQEKIGDKVYFWQQVDIFESVKHIKGELFRKNLTILALVEPLTPEMFQKDAAQYIQNGFFPRRAVKLKVQVLDGPFIEVDPAQYFSHQDVIETTPYSRTPDAMGKIDFSRMRFLDSHERITVPAGTMMCDHILVSTDAQREYFDEGFDLWRSASVPLLGIVKMEFSKTCYWEKRGYQNKKKVNSVQAFIAYLLHKRVPGRDRPDTYVAQLIDYGPVGYP